MRRLFLTAILSAATLVSFSQTEPKEEKKFTFSAGLRAAFPTGDWRSTPKFGAGLDLQAELRFASVLSGVFSSGMIYFFKKDFPNQRNKIVVPVMVGLRIYPVPVFFIGGKAGLAAGHFYNGSYGPEIGLNLRRFQFVALHNVIFETDYQNNHFGLSVLYKFK